ncbi:MAG: hypothetical protein V2A73_12365 [Pseudomonadota bacterium]
MLNLTVFFEDYCSLIHRLWHEVPVVWESGLPVLQPTPRNHFCGGRPRQAETAEQ